MAPIDPDQLLKALDSLLSPEGGIRSMEDVPRLVSLMKKFSKKLVSRCVYCNVLQSTQKEILSEYLSKGGWETINLWLQYAKSSSSPCFLIEMLKLCKLLPMTLERLKENNTAKLIKSLNKHENSDVKSLSSELVTCWMVIIKGAKGTENTVVMEKKKKKEKLKEKEKSKDKSESDKKGKDVKAQEETKSNIVEPKSPVKLKGTKRMSSEKETKKIEYYEDVKLDPEPLTPVSKKPKTDRPKTAKIYQKKFRATGLEEEMPVPKKIQKKGNTVDKVAAFAAVKSNLKLHTNPPERFTEKKIKPENLLTINESATSNKGIKLIPAKPQPVYNESSSFIDALTPQPSVPLKRKKKTPHNKGSMSPTSPTNAPPKLQFYKDTLEMNEEDKKEDNEKENISTESEDKRKDILMEVETSIEEDKPMDTSESERSSTPPNTELEEITDKTDKTTEMNDANKSNQLRSILSHGRKKTKRNVKFPEDDRIKEIFYFELDETERVNVLKTQNFGDMKSIELKREREALEMAKRQAGDRMDEQTSWWAVPILVDLPPPIVESGYQSVEKEYERIRQESTLQEIYFTKEMIPDSPHEPDLEIVPPQEPKIIPIDEENTIGSVMNHSSYEFPKPPPIEDVLSTLMQMNPPPNIQNNFHELPMDSNMCLPPTNIDLINHHNTPYDPAEPVSAIPPNNLAGPGVPMTNIFNMASQPMPPESMHAPTIVLPPVAEWRPMEGLTEQFFAGPGWNPGRPMMIPNGSMRPRMTGDMFRPTIHNNLPPRGPRPRNIHKVPCRHFLSGSCRFAMKCSFLHPGINGPPL